jgi:GDP-4-dehydro-6-deoxy-D-mannose reductase
VTADPAPILVTGAAGFAGSHLLDVLRQEPRRGALFGWHHPTMHANASGVAWQGVDLNNAASVREAIEESRPAQVYHLAGAADVGRAWKYAEEALRVNALGTHHLLDALRRVGLDARVLVIGSAAVYRPTMEAVDEESPIGPTSPYGVSKLAQEMTALQAHALHGQRVIVARAFNHIGPRQSAAYFSGAFAEQIVEIEKGTRHPAEIRHGNLEGRRDLTDVRDTVRAYGALMEHGQPGHVYNVCSGEAHAVGDVLDHLIALSGVRVEKVKDETRWRREDQPLLVGRCDRLTRTTGWRREIPLERTLMDILQDWRGRVAAA